MASEYKTTCMGIDLGTTHACVGVFANGRVNILANDQGFRSTPCYVSFLKDEAVVGSSALEKLHSNSANTVYHLKKIIGKRYSDIKNEKFVQNWGFKLSSSECADDVPVFLPQHIEAAEASQDKSLIAEKTYSVQDFCSMLFQNLRRLAEEFTGEVVTNAVITVPSSFDDRQRDVLTKAALTAGLNILKVVSEPLAVAIAYGLDEPTKETKAEPEYALIFDLGGATHAISVVNADRGFLTTLASLSDDTLGGEDFTNALVDYCIKTMEKKQNISIHDNEKALRRLKFECERAKKSLTQQTQTTLEIDSIAEGQDFIMKLSRSRFEDVIYNDLKKTIAQIEKVLGDANLEKEDITKIILSGGSTQIPKFQEMLKEFFNGKDLSVQVAPEEAVAIGATIEASTLMESKNLDLPDVDGVEVTPLSLSVAVANGSVVHIVNRESVLPVSCTETFSTAENDQTSIFLELYEGERAMAKDNTLLGRLVVDGIPPMPQGDAHVDVTFTVDVEGQLTVTACESSSGVQKECKIARDDSRLSKEDVDALVQAAEDAADEDDELLDALENATIAEGVSTANGEPLATFDGGDMD